LNPAETAAAEVPTAASSVRLEKNTISAVGLAALAIGITSPAMGLFALWGTMEAATGPVTPVIFISAMFVMLPTGISYAVLNSRFPSAGAASTWLWRSVSPVAGFLAGLMMTTYFLMATVSVPVMFAMFFADFMRVVQAPVSHMNSLFLGVLISTIPAAFFCLRGAEASIKVTVRLMLIETFVVLALSATILFFKAKEAGGINFGPFNPRNATQGLTGFWAAMVVGVLGFCGFDVVSTAAEEANAPRTHLPRAIFITLVGMAVFWAINAWVFTLGIPLQQVVDYTTAGVPAVTGIAERYWGFGSLTVDIIAFTGVTAVYLSCVQGSSRIIFALARHGLLPSIFGRLAGRRRVPRNAVLGVLICAVGLDMVTLVVLRNGLDTFNWWSFALVFFANLTFMAVNIANATYFFRFARSDFRWLTNLLIPIVGFLVNVYMLYAAFFSALWSSDLPTGRSVVIGCLLILAVEVVAVTWMRLFTPRLFLQAAPINADGS
jgi:basic amino acid/polyamine antiporter, APA family